MLLERSQVVWTVQGLKQHHSLGQMSATIASTFDLISLKKHASEWFLFFFHTNNSAGLANIPIPGFISYAFTV